MIMPKSAVALVKNGSSKPQSVALSGLGTHNGLLNNKVVQINKFPAGEQVSFTVRLI